MFCEWVPEGEVSSQIILTQSNALDENARRLVGNQVSTLPNATTPVQSGTAVYDLGGVYNLTSLSLYASYGNNTKFRLSIRETEQDTWTEIGFYNYPGGSAALESWNGYHSTTVRARYIRINDMSGNFYEFRVYGYEEQYNMLSPLMVGSTVNLDNPQYAAGVLAFHASMEGIEIPNGYIAVEYGTVIMRGALLEGTELTKKIAGVVITCRRSVGGLILPKDLYALLRTADVDASGTVAAGYARTRYAARAYIVYVETSTGEEYTLYSDDTLISSVNRIRRALACRLMEGGVAFGTYDREAVLTGVQADIEEVWVFILENKELLLYSVSGKEEEALA